MNDLSQDVLKKLAKLQQIKNYNTLSKENLMYALLRSQNPNEENYIKHITNDINITELDNEIRAKINDIKVIGTRLDNVLTKARREVVINKDGSKSIVTPRNKITKELYESLKKLNDKKRNARLRKSQKDDKMIKKIIKR